MGETLASEADLRQAHSLREALREALATRAGGGRYGRARANGTLAGLSMRIEFGTDGTPCLSRWQVVLPRDPPGSQRGGRGSRRQLAAAEDVGRAGLPLGIPRHFSQ